MNMQILNTIGLALGMIGVLIIFKYGPPQPNLDQGVGLGLELQTMLSDGRTVAQHDAEQRALRKRYSRMSKAGLGFVFVGFAVQLVAVWWPA